MKMRIGPFAMPLVLGIFLLSWQSVTMAQATGKKPNIVIIMGDDVGWFNIGAYHQGMMSGKTPNIDKLAREGMRFTDYCAEASCTAGRANFITGQLQAIQAHHGGWAQPTNERPKMKHVLLRGAVVGIVVAVCVPAIGQKPQPLAAPSTAAGGKSEQPPAERNVLAADLPEKEITEVTYTLIHKQVHHLIGLARDQFHGDRIVYLGGVVINTDGENDDSLDIRDHGVMA